MAEPSRAELIETAVRFLAEPSIQGQPKEAIESYLQTKLGLSPQEIQQAYARAGKTSDGSAAPAGAAGASANPPMSDPFGAPPAASPPAAAPFCAAPAANPFAAPPVRAYSPRSRTNHLWLPV